MRTTILLIFMTFYLTSFNAQTNNSQPIHVEVTGKGKPIIFIPGFTVPGEIWKPMAKELEANYESHLVTLAGFGGKDPIAFPWLPKVNEALKNYILKNDLQQVTIIGHSIGGTIATWLATQKELNLAEIIIIDGLPATGALLMPNFDPKNLVYDSMFNKEQLAMAPVSFKHSVSAMAKNLSLKEEAQNKILNWMLAADRKTYVYGYTDYLKLDLRKELDKISIPVSIIAASTPYGEAMVKQTYKNQYAKLKNYDFYIAKESGHFIMLDQPEWLLNQVQMILSY